MFKWTLKKVFNETLFMIMQFKSNETLIKAYTCLADVSSSEMLVGARSRAALSVGVILPFLN
jgi:hypothetical protein